MEKDRSKVASEWLTRASETLRFTEAGFAETQISADACYGSQQAAEKALKAALVAHNQRPPRTHDIADLLDRAQAVQPSLQELADDARVSLTPGTRQNSKRISR